MDSLVASLRTFDYAILILRADDQVISRDLPSPATRDNVLFELGLFIGHLGPRRTFVVFDRANPTKILSDLHGIAFAPYDGNVADLQSAVGVACNLIRRELNIHEPENWYAEYRLGSNLYRETLIYSLYSNDVPEISGRKVYERDGGKTQIYDLLGFRGEGFDWLEYHARDGSGGGAIMLRTGTTHVRTGLIIAGHCETGVLRCYANRWVRNGEATYDPAWLRELGNISAERF